MLYRDRLTPDRRTQPRHRGNDSGPTQSIVVRRRGARLRVQAAFGVFWNERASQPKYLKAFCSELSEQGLSLETSDPIPVGTRLSLRADSGALFGEARVKHVTKRGAKYILGVELSSCLMDEAFALVRETYSSVPPNHCKIPVGWPRTPQKELTLAGGQTISGGEDAMSITETDQRRRTSRRKVSAPSVIRVEFKDGMGNPRNITADLMDWSARGLSLTLVAPIELGTTIQLRGKLGDDCLDISCRATIAWCIEDLNGGFRVGLEFTDGQPHLPNG